MLTKIREKFTGGIAIAILGTIVVSFVFVGGSGVGFSGQNYAAKVDGVDISIGRFEAVYREQLQGNPQLATLSPEFRLRLRTNLLEQLIQQLVIDNYLDEAGFRVSDEDVTRLIQRVPEFKVDGKFDIETYRNLLSLSNYEPTQFERVQRQTLRRAQLQRAIRETSIVTPAGYRRFLNLGFEQRIVTTASITAESVANEVVVTDEMITAYYDDNPALFQVPETADIEYVEIRRDEVARSVSITEQQLQEFYEFNSDRYLRDEQRRARHILILFDNDEAGAEIVANEMLTRVRAGESFEELARQYSKDGGTAAQGGDLGTLTRTQMPDELGDEIFSMSTGDIVGPLKSDFGFHIVRLDEILERGPLPLEQIRAALLTELQDQEANGLYRDLERKLSDALFDAADIQGLAAAIDGSVNTVSAYSRSGGEPFADSQVAVEAIFSADVLSGAQLSELTELDANRTVVFSVTQHNPSARQPLDDVREQVSAALTSSQTEDLMAAKTRQMLDALAAGDDFATAAETIAAPVAAATVMTRNAEGLDQYVAVAVFTAVKPIQDAATIGSTRNSAGGYTVFSLDAVIPGRPEAIPLADRDAGKVQLVDRYGLGDFFAFVQVLRANAEVIISGDVLAAQDVFQ
ncbi:MAG: SurA N-terminal domain-containing protein [Proteobacteria bacterium]|nr:SurA N-terminal domain-containing protein [Pseudomonadota bacterium]